MESNHAETTRQIKIVGQPTKQLSWSLQKCQQHGRQKNRQRNYSILQEATVMGQLTGQCDVWLDPGLTDKMAQLYKTVSYNWINMNMTGILLFNNVKCL